MKEQAKLRELFIVRVVTFLFVIFKCCFLLFLYVKPTTSNFDLRKVPLTIIPVTGRRLDYTIFSVDIGVTGVTKNNRLFAVTPTSTTRSTLLRAVFFPPIDIQLAL